MTYRERCDKALAALIKQYAFSGDIHETVAFELLTLAEKCGELISKLEAECNSLESIIQEFE
jgi:hypothetical protein